MTASPSVRCCCGCCCSVVDAAAAASAPDVDEGFSILAPSSLAAAAAAAFSAFLFASAASCPSSGWIATLIDMGLPSSSLPWKSFNARCWSSFDSKSTNAKPLDRPADWPNLRTTTTADLTLHSGSNASFSEAFVTLKLRLPTKTSVDDSTPVVGGPRRPRVEPPATAFAAPAPEP